MSLPESSEVISVLLCNEDYSVECCHDHDVMLGMEKKRKKRPEKEKEGP